MMAIISTCGSEELSECLDSYFSLALLVQYFEGVLNLFLANHPLTKIPVDVQELLKRHHTLRTVRVHLFQNLEGCTRSDTDLF